MKKVFTLITVLVFMCGMLGCFTVTAVEQQSGDWAYQLLEDGTAEIRGYTGEETDIEIPSEIEGYAVTSIGADVFEANKDLTSVTLPDTITKIGDWAFSECTLLTSITFPENLTEIGEGAFTYCSSLTSVDVSENNPAFCSVDGVLFNKDVTEILLYPLGKEGTEYTVPEGVTSIGDYAFLYSALTEITLPSTLVSIGYQGFAGCQNLTSITLPEGLTEIGKYAFAYCSALLAVTIPEGVTIIEQGTFHACTSITEIIIPKSVTDVSSAAFAYCGSLTIYSYAGSDAEALANKFGVPFVVITEEDIVEPEPIDPLEGLEYTVLEDGTAEITGYTGEETELEIPSEIDGYAVTVIGESAFWDCSELTSIIIPEGVTSIGEYAFFFCSAVTFIELPNSVTTIGYGAFGLCSSLTSITIPNSVTTIGELAFTGAGLMSISVAENNPNYCDIDGVLFNKDVTEIIQYPIDKTDTEYTIPDSVTSIEDYAFYSCGVLTSITIPENNPNYCSINGVLFNKDVTEIIQYPIGRTDTEYTIPNGVTTISDSAFYQCKSLTSITIPVSVTEIGDTLGYAFDFDSLSDYKIENLTIYGYAGSTAEEYALENEIPFISLEEKEIIPGDLNGDNTVSMSDFVMLMQFVNGTREVGEYLPTADIDKDNVITVFDFALLKRKLLIQYQV